MDWFVLRFFFFVWIFPGSPLFFSLPFLLRNEVEGADIVVLVLGG